MPVNDLWTSRAVALTDASQWVHHSDHPGAPASDPFESVRQNVQALVFEIKPTSVGDEARVDNVRLGPHTPQGFGFYTGNAPGPAVGLYGVWTDDSIFDLRAQVPLPVGQWIHAAVTYDGRTLRQYFDGRLQSELADANKTLATSDLTIGKGYDAVDDVPTYFHGMVDEVCVLHRALAPFEIRNIYRAGTAGLDKEAEAWDKRVDPPVPALGPVVNIGYDGQRVLLDWPQGQSSEIWTNYCVTNFPVTPPWIMMQAPVPTVIGCRYFIAVDPFEFPTRTNLYFRAVRP